MYTDLHIICFGFQCAAITGRSSSSMCVLAILHPAAEILRKQEKQMSKPSLHTTPNYVGTTGQEGDKANKPRWIPSGCIFLLTTANCFRSGEGSWVRWQRVILCSFEHIYFSNCTWFWITSKYYKAIMKTVFQRDPFFFFFLLAFLFAKGSLMWKNNGRSVLRFGFCSLHVFGHGKLTWGMCRLDIWGRQWSTTFPSPSFENPHDENAAQRTWLDNFIIQLYWNVLTLPHTKEKVSRRLLFKTFLSTRERPYLQNVVFIRMLWQCIWHRLDAY